MTSDVWHEDPPCALAKIPVLQSPTAGVSLGVAKHVCRVIVELGRATDGSPLAVHVHLHAAGQRACAVHQPKCVAYHRHGGILMITSECMVASMIYT